MKVEFNQEMMDIGGTGAFSVNVDLIRNEPMFYSAAWDFVMSKGGKLTLDVMAIITGSPQWQKDIAHHAAIGYHPVIDTKVVQLMPGWYPCIPGWHCDGVVRPASGDQPDMSRIGEPVYHYAVSYASDDRLCPTLFVDNRVSLEVDEGNVWASVNREVDAELSKDDPLDVREVKSGQMLRFNRATIHRCTAADRDGWRFFFRLSFFHMPVANEIRKQVQVYLEDKGAGW